MTRALISGHGSYISSSWPCEAAVWHSFTSVTLLTAETSSFRFEDLKWLLSLPLASYFLLHRRSRAVRYYEISSSIC